MNCSSERLTGGKSGESLLCARYGVFLGGKHDFLGALHAGGSIVLQ